MNIKDIINKYPAAGELLAKQNIGCISCIRTAIKAIEDGKYAIAESEITSYGILLTEHIKKEDDILYPWMDRELSDHQVGQLFSACAEVDTRFGEKPAYYRKLAATMAERYAGK